MLRIGNFQLTGGSTVELYWSWLATFANRLAKRVTMPATSGDLQGFPGVKRRKLPKQANLAYWLPAPAPVPPPATKPPKPKPPAAVAPAAAAARQATQPPQQLKRQQPATPPVRLYYRAGKPPRPGAQPYRHRAAAATHLPTNKPVQSGESPPRAAVVPAVTCLPPALRAVESVPHTPDWWTSLLSGLQTAHPPQAERAFVNENGKWVGAMESQTPEEAAAAAAAAQALTAAQLRAKEREKHAQAKTKAKAAARAAALATAQAAIKRADSQSAERQADQTAQLAAAQAVARESVEKQAEVTHAFGNGLLSTLRSVDSAEMPEVDRIMAGAALAGWDMTRAAVRRAKDRDEELGIKERARLESESARPEVEREQPEPLMQRLTRRFLRLVGAKEASGSTTSRSGETSHVPDQQSTELQPPRAKPEDNAPRAQLMPNDASPEELEKALDSISPSIADVQSHLSPLPAPPEETLPSDPESRRSAAAVSAGKREVSNAATTGIPSSAETSAVSMGHMSNRVKTTALERRKAASPSEDEDKLTSAIERKFRVDAAKEVLGHLDVFYGGGHGKVLASQRFTRSPRSRLS